MRRAVEPVSASRPPLAQPHRSRSAERRLVADSGGALVDTIDQGVEYVERVDDVGRVASRNAREPDRLGRRVELESRRGARLSALKLIGRRPVLVDRAVQVEAVPRATPIRLDALQTSVLDGNVVNAGALRGVHHRSPPVAARKRAVAASSMLTPKRGKAPAIIVSLSCCETKLPRPFIPESGNVTSRNARN